MVRDNMSSSLCENDGPGKFIGEELIPKKVRFREKEEEPSNDMMIELSSDQPTSWRDMLVGQSSKNGSNGLDEKEAFDILEGDIQRTVVNGVPSITFSERIHQIFIQGMGMWKTFVEMNANSSMSIPENQKMTVEEAEKKEANSRPWMILERKSRQVGSNMLLGPVFKYGNGPQLDPSFIQKNTNNIVQINEKVTTALGLEDAVPKQAWNLMDCNAQIEGMQQSPGAPSSCSRASVAENMPKQTIDGATLHVEGEPSTHRVNLILKGADRGEVILDVGSLDSGKHSAVVFFENKEVQPSNGSLYELSSGSSKRNIHSSDSANNLDNTWIYLSTNRVMARYSGYATTGGVARDLDGNWIVGSTLFLGVCSPFDAEVANPYFD
ncbi:hypothetical protein PVK06_016406 [Gossypium arboreum]|uniref:Uncharacterized protein n=1 Tax=Gossypium arboreum TaxID=29729 RepID=A0ABR0Q0D2_GOSAR|nr:hypothetical protein PVK06_016406 [Gossypium arboreum]